ncbi:zinc finger protein 836 [Anabrus simplex]|uniref:zinc finger protein 836 n=1 Tax=Anabrus simplex TaxID=316456 RepID=UPI0035A2E14B
MLQNNQSPLQSKDEFEAMDVELNEKSQECHYVGGEDNNEDEGGLGVRVSLDTILELHNIDVELPVACDFCPEKFMDLDKFDEHMAHHSECRFFSCQLCSNTYVSWGNLVAHRKACHRSEVISCDSCGQRKHHLNLGPVNFPVGKYPIGCEECNEGFSTIIQLYRHYRLRGKHGRKLKVPGKDDSLLEGIQLQPEMFACPVCSSQFFTVDQLKAHLTKLEKDETSYSCSICSMRFCNAQVLVMHKRTHPDAKVSKSYLCPICGRVLRDRTTYIRHKMIHTGEKPYQCDWCPKSFIRKSALDLHKYTHPVSEDYNCFNCGLWYKEMSDLREHIQQEHSSGKEATLTCGICKEECLAEKFLDHYQKCHMAREEECARLRQETVTCSLCKKVFSQPTALARHLKLHDATNKQPFKCDVCEEVLKQRYELLIHLRTHYGDDDENLPEKYQKILKEFLQHRKYRETAAQMSFICEYCGREFRKKINLQLHVRRHTGERPHLCQLCGKAFYTRQQLAIHMRQHTGERPYECPVCQKTFTGPTALYMHRRLHNRSKKQYKCQYCSREFFWRSGYIGHLRLHSGERPYKCTLCPKAFTLKGKLNLHMKKHEHDHVIHTCETCGEHFGTLEELTTHEADQCCSTTIAIMEGDCEGEEYIVLENEVPDNQVYFMKENITELAVSENS